MSEPFGWVKVIGNIANKYENLGQGNRRKKDKF
jgi:hypothetical protein